MLVPVFSTRFKRDIKHAEKRGKDMAKLKIAVERLIEQIPLPAEYRDHPLRGNWKGYRDLHIEPDWLILYRVEADELFLTRTGRHTDLFDE